ncbi:MAG: hypothetical protein RLZZ472_158, partial [Pseudomonadota bacterium]
MSSNSHLWQIPKVELPESHLSKLQN